MIMKVLLITMMLLGVHKVFGLDLEILCKAERRHCPKLIICIIDYLEQKCKSKTVIICLIEIELDRSTKSERNNEFRV